MSRSSAPVSLALAVSSACVAFACSSSEPRTFDVRVAVTTRGGEPVPGAEVQLRSEPPAATNDAIHMSIQPLSCTTPRPMIAGPALPSAVRTCSDFRSHPILSSRSSRNTQGS